MKIRTNFVTNSSSYSSAEIRIDNPVLLEILEKYRDLGAFRDYDGDDHFSRYIGVNARETKEEYLMEVDPFMEEEELEEELEDIKDDNVALYFFESEQAEIFDGPNRIEDVAMMILDVVERCCFGGYENSNLVKDFARELSDRAEEINKNYIEVFWNASNDGYGEAEPEEGEQTQWEFEYHK